jgi:pilus assembly protein CpaF
VRLADRLGAKGNGGVHQAPVAPSARREVATMAARLHARILDRLDLTVVSQLGAEELRQRLRQIVEQLLAAERMAASEEERNAVVESVMDELVGLGPLEPLLKDPTVSDVLVNGCERVFVERAGKLVPVDVRFRDDRHLTHTIQRIVARIGRRIDESSPMVDARLPDGSRVNAVIPPLAIDGPALSIRRFGSRPLSAQDLVRNGAISPEMLDYLYSAVRARRTILITGGTGAGKTTLLNALSSFIPTDERIITVEDAAELRLDQPHVVRLESRPQNLEGKGEVSIRDLVRNALRMRPDRIVVGEVRGAEVLDMLQAMNTGHEGSLSTIHANNTRDAVSRLTTMLGMAGTAFTEETMKTLIARAIHVVVHVARLQDGKRRVTGISEITGQMGATIQMHDVFTFERTGVAPSGAVVGQHKAQARSTLVQVVRAQAQPPAAVAPAPGRAP